MSFEGGKHYIRLRCDFFSLFVLLLLFFSSSSICHIHFFEKQKIGQRGRRLGKPKKSTVQSKSAHEWSPSV